MPSTASPLDICWVVICAALVMLMQAGFCCLETGLVRAKNSINVSVKNLFDFCVAGFCFWVFGYQLMFGPSLFGWLGGSTNMSFHGVTPHDYAFFLFQLVFCGTSTTIISGAVAERMRFSAYLAISLLTSALFYPLFGHWAWGGVPGDVAGGWLKHLGFVDFAGSTVVHSLGGWLSLAAIIILGPRRGRYAPGPQPIPGHNLPLSTLGVFLLWFGWFGFNGGSTLALDERVPHILVTTNLAACMGGLAALAVAWIRTGRPDVPLAMNGVLAGLVGITAGCHAVSPLSALIIGAIAGILSVGAVSVLDRLKIDDVVSAVPVHAVGGVFGTLAVALFGDPKLLGTGLTFWQQLGVQSLGCVACATWALAGGGLILLVMNKFYPLRVTEKDEMQGLNVAEHGASTALHDLLNDMHSQEQQADFSQPVVIEPHTEVGEIAAQYNRVLLRVDAEIQTREEAVAALRVAEEKYRRIFEDAVEGIFQTTPEGQYLCVNPALARIYGYDTPTHLITELTDISRSLYTDPQRRGQFVEQIHASGVVMGFESEVRRRDGGTAWISENARVVRDEAGEVMFYEGTVEDITQRKQSEEFERQTALAQAASRSKSEFLAKMSHEIRTPLNGVIGMLELLAATELTPRQARYARVGRSSAESLLTVVNDILDFSKIEAGKIELANLDFNLVELAEDVAEMFADRAASKGLELVCRISPEVPMHVHGDPDRLRQVLVNLVGNAMKFTERGEIVIDVEVRSGEGGDGPGDPSHGGGAGKPSWVRLAVRDSGIGIPKDKLDRLFQSFSQVDASTTRKYGGTGLGLAICSQLIGLMGGRVGVDSQLGEGSTFWCLVPLTPAKARRDRRQGDRRQIVPAALASLQVLAVDDNATNLEILREQLTGWGLAIDCVSRPVDALKRLDEAAARGRGYGLFILDHQMPGMDGDELSAEIRRRKAYVNAPILMLSSSADLGPGPSSLEGGAFIQLVKPARQSRLYDALITLAGGGKPKENNHPAATEALTPLTHATGRCPRLLIVEDNEVNQLVTRELLESFGGVCDVAWNGEVGLQRMESQAYDVVLMDCQMPIRDGFEATKIWRERETQRGGTRLPIIALTANAVEGDRRRCMEAGMDDYITKPINSSELHAAVRRALSSPHTATPPAPTATTKDEVPLTVSAASSADASPLDAIEWESLRRRCLGREDLVGMVLKTFAEKSPETMSQLRNALESKLYDDVARCAHALKGMSGNVGANQVMELSIVLEDASHHPSPEELAACYTALEAAMDRVLETVKSYFRSSPSARVVAKKELELS